MNAKFGSQSMVHHTISAQNVLEIQQILNDDEEIRAKFHIANGHYISLNDILISIASGALRGLLLKSSEEMNGEMINNSVYKTLMIVGKPFEIETAKSIENSWIPASIPFLVNVEDDIERCIETANNLKPIKRYWHLWANFFALEKLGNFWIDAVKCISYRLSNTHCCHYSYLNFKPFKDQNTFIFATDIMINDIGIFVGDTVKTHVVELFKFGNKISLNLSVGQKGQKHAFIWFQKFEHICAQLLDKLKERKERVSV